MFTKKYVFETKRTRSRRILKSVYFLIFLGFIGFITLAVYIPIFAKNQNEKSNQAFYGRTPDVIAVFTGDRGRIDYAFKMAEKYPSAKIFITGVYAKNNLEILIKGQGKNTSIEDYIEEESHHIELDYLARNTVENGLATLNYVRKLPNAKTILIVSSDYHIFRISHIMEALSDDKSKYEFYYQGIQSDYTEKSNLQKLLKEVYKLFKTSTFLFFWDPEVWL